MRRITLGILIALCAITSPDAQAPASAQGFGGASPAQSRVTGTITLALDARETPRKLLHCARNIRRHAGRADARLSEVAAGGARARRGDGSTWSGLKFSGGRQDAVMGAASG